MSWIMDGMRTLVGYLLMISIAMEVLPDKKYEGYLRMLGGLLILLLVLRPVLKIGTMESFLEERVDTLLEEQKKAEQQYDFSGIAGDTWHQVWERELLDFFQRAGYEVKSMEVSTEEERCTGMTAVLSKNQGENVRVEKIVIDGSKGTDREDNVEMTALVQSVTEAYGIEADAVNLEVQE